MRFFRNSLDLALSILFMWQSASDMWRRRIQNVGARVHMSPLGIIHFSADQQVWRTVTDNGLVREFEALDGDNGMLKYWKGKHENTAARDAPT